MPNFQDGVKCQGLQLPQGSAIYIGDVPIWPCAPLYGLEHHCGTRVTLAEMNAGKTLLAARANAKYRLTDVKIIAIGGAAQATANATGVAVYGTQSGTSTALYTALLAAMTENALCQFGTANTSIPNAGATFARNDNNTAITCRAVSAGNYDLITATHFDVHLRFCLEG